MIKTDNTSAGTTQVDYVVQILEDDKWEEFYTFDTLEKAEKYFQLLKESEVIGHYRLLQVETLLVHSFSY